MGARSSGWFRPGPELRRAAALARYDRECIAWSEQQRATLAQAIVAAKRSEYAPLRRAIDALADVFRRSPR